jgi:hypothetical protein
VTVAAEAASDLSASMEYISSDWQYVVHEKIFILPLPLKHESAIAAHQIVWQGFRAPARSSRSAFSVTMTRVRCRCSTALSR